MRDGVSVDVGIEDTDRKALRGQRGGEVHGHGGLTDATLTGGDGEHAGAGVRLGEWDHRLGGGAADGVAELAALLVIHHIGGDGDVANALDTVQRLFGALDDGVFHGATGNGEVNLHGHVIVVRHRDGLDHANLGNRATYLRIFDLRQGGANFSFSNRRHYVVNLIVRPRKTKNY